MDEIQRFTQRNLRRILAVGGLILSLFAMSILLNTSPKSSVWMVTNPVPAGAKITALDVRTVKANLATDALHFEGESDVVIGQYSTRLLQIGDIVAVTDVTKVSRTIATTFLPIGVAVNDIPVDLNAGDLVDIYMIPKDQSGLPGIVAKRVAVQGVDQRSRSLGGSVSVSLVTNSSETISVVTAESQGRLVLARDAI